MEHYVNAFTTSSVGFAFLNINSSCSFALIYVCVRVFYVHWGELVDGWRIVNVATNHKLHCHRFIQQSYPVLEVNEILCCTCYCCMMNLLSTTMT